MCPTMYTLNGIMVKETQYLQQKKMDQTRIKVLHSYVSILLCLEIVTRLQKDPLK